MLSKNVICGFPMAMPSLTKIEPVGENIDRDILGLVYLKPKPSVFKYKSNFMTITVEELTVGSCRTD